MSSVLIVGASARAAAQSAVRAGFNPVCIDRFGDVDTKRIARVVPTADYPAGSVQAANQFPPMPWLYTGALENRPGIIRRISRQHRLWGNPPDVVRPVRDPLQVHEALSQRDLPVPAVRSATDVPPADGRWLIKPYRSGGGSGIAVWGETRAAGKRLLQRHYFQRRIDGDSIAAVFVATDRNATLLGVTRQLIGERWLNARPFAYCGSLGPIRLPSGVERQIARTGAALAEDFDLIGLFGVDLIYDGVAAWPVEVNPRYTASVEILELASGRSLLAIHRDACEGGPDSTQCQPTSSDAAVWAKAIVYATTDFVVPEDIEHAVGDAARMADVPAAGMQLPAGHPICTLIRQAPSVAAALAELRPPVERLATSTSRPRDCGN